jgi:hypothetical protein
VIGQHEVRRARWVATVRGGWLQCAAGEHDVRTSLVCSARNSSVLRDTPGSLADRRAAIALQMRLDPMAIRLPPPQASRRRRLCPRTIPLPSWFPLLRIIWLWWYRRRRLATKASRRPYGVELRYGGNFMRARMALNSGSSRMGSSCGSTFNAMKAGSRCCSDLASQCNAEALSPHCA